MLGGEGYQGQVRKAININNLDEELACKILKIEKTSAIQNEIKALQNLEYSPFLVNYKKIYMHSQHNFYFFMEYCRDQNLQQLIENQ